MGGHGFGGGSGLVGINNECESILCLIDDADPSSYLSKPTVEGDNWMITQQAASFLIKKMTAASGSRFQVRDRTDELFSWYLNETRPSAQVVHGTKISNEAIVTAFRWRAAELVCLAPQCSQCSRSDTSTESPGFQS
jgi:acyl-CoA oxidase